MFVDLKFQLQVTQMYIHTSLSAAPVSGPKPSEQILINFRPSTYSSSTLDLSRGTRQRYRAHVSEIRVWEEAKGKIDFD